MAWYGTFRSFANVAKLVGRDFNSIKIMFCPIDPVVLRIDRTCVYAIVLLRKFDFYSQPGAVTGIHS